MANMVRTHLFAWFMSYVRELLVVVFSTNQTAQREREIESERERVKERERVRLAER